MGPGGGEGGGQWDKGRNETGEQWDREIQIANRDVGNTETENRSAPS